MATRARNISLEDVLGIAMALGVNPVELIVPQDADILLRIGSAEISPQAARDWFRQKQPLRKQDEKTYFTEVPQEEWDRYVRGIHQSFDLPLLSADSKIYSLGVEQQELDDGDE